MFWTCIHTCHVTSSWMKIFPVQFFRRPHDLVVIGPQTFLCNHIMYGTMLFCVWTLWVFFQGPGQIWLILGYLFQGSELSEVTCIWWYYYGLLRMDNFIIFADHFLIPFERQIMSFKKLRMYLKSLLWIVNNYSLATRK